ncbi:hypothetical protein FRACYDRAFT_249129 [Fragilariopsis cylindrus CCMP1102]|uniref:5-formyltetrahydrofolate cyclo-ligase n=1 Tax=Fragilariopsis cylindrus CCMP1102 TaxID=635003 RepID=A0A1E7ESG6_9STRA|nr:hypothetical protein FRACYDRAFT_249129 [Fragilariopsis cylindrus CCMP1102]|eukprot:OEU08787.1 hypothetical protein FRACYDRAFT_249129 [Fragilariopsis cylindrus CCMP1102]
MELIVVLRLVTINLLILAQVDVSLVHCFVQQTGFRAREVGKPSRSSFVGDDGGKIFDEESYEKDRLAKDAKAMDAMKAVADIELNKKGDSSDISNNNDKQQQQQLRSPWKWTLRKRIWDYMEENDIARFPRPVHHRIPNFVGADLAAKRLIQLPEFQSASIVKVNPDTPQRPVQLPSLVEIEQCTNSKGVVKYGTPITLNEEYKVDLVVVGSTAVCPRTGARVGKGEGFAELEWGILSAQGNLNAETCLLKEETEEKLGEVLPSGPEELLPPLAVRNSKKKNSGNNKNGKKQRQPQRPAAK